MTPADASTSVLPVPDYMRRADRRCQGAPRGTAARLLPGRRRAGGARVGRDRRAGAGRRRRRGGRGEARPHAARRRRLAGHRGRRRRWPITPSVLRTRAAEYDPDVARRLRAGAFVTGVHYVRAQQVRALVRDAVDGALARRDVLLAPSTPIAAPPVDARQVDARRWTGGRPCRAHPVHSPVQFSGHPACSVPCGFTAGGLPSACSSSVGPSTRPRCCARRCVAAPHRLSHPAPRARMPLREER